MNKKHLKLSKKFKFRNELKTYDTHISYKKYARNEYNQKILIFRRASRSGIPHRISLESSNKKKIKYIG